jgi:hypothetical protein
VADPCIYYELKDSGKGIDPGRQINPDPLHASYLRTTAGGLGINMGCPVRLLRAIDVLATLPRPDQATVNAQLRNMRTHLSTVEELLWLSGWKWQSKPRRGPKFAGMTGDVDWTFGSDREIIFLESKFRDSDWPRLTDGPSASTEGAGYLSKALHKFPHPPQDVGIHAVGITLMDNINDNVVRSIVGELRGAPGIHVVILRTLIYVTYVISLKPSLGHKVRARLKAPDFRELPCGYGIIFDRGEQARRVESRPIKCVEGADLGNYYFSGFAPTGAPR